MGRFAGIVDLAFQFKDVDLLAAPAPSGLFPDRTLLFDVGEEGTTERVGGLAQALHIFGDGVPFCSDSLQGDLVRAFAEGRPFQAHQRGHFPHEAQQDLDRRLAEIGITFEAFDLLLCRAQLFDLRAKFGVLAVKFGELIGSELENACEHESPSEIEG